jgi:hypothetical protein
MTCLGLEIKMAQAILEENQWKVSSLMMKLGEIL